MTISSLRTLARRRCSQRASGGFSPATWRHLRQFCRLGKYGAYRDQRWVTAPRDLLPCTIEILPISARQRPSVVSRRHFMAIAIEPVCGDSILAIGAIAKTIRTDAKSTGEAPAWSASTSSSIPAFFTTSRKFYQSTHVIPATSDIEECNSIPPLATGVINYFAYTMRPGPSPFAGP